MSSAFIKSRLKSAREALGNKDFVGACDTTLQILEHEPLNYNANVFLGLALLELNETEKSEQAYRKAIDSNPEQALAWQGISKLYERTERWDKYMDTLNRLVSLYARSNDTTKCAEGLQRFVACCRERGSRLQVVEALTLLLPESPIHPVLSTLPPFDPTNPTSTTFYTIQVAIHDSLSVLQEIVALLEKNEEETFKKEVEKRRMRLGAAGPEQLRKDVGVEVWGTSQLPHFYNEILNHQNTPDDLRRSTESKLLRHTQQYLHALPVSASNKAQVANDLNSLVDGAVILKIPDELAWTIFIEGHDCDTIEGYNYRHFLQFMELFPVVPLTMFLKGYFRYMSIPLAKPEDDEIPLDKSLPEDYDPFDAMLDAFSALPNSIVACRILVDVYVGDLDHQNAIKVAEGGLELVSRAEIDNGKKLTRVRKGFNVVLGTSLVHFFPPKHHARALRIIDDILGDDPNHVTCLLGRAYILQRAGKWSDAGSLFAKVVELLPEDLNNGLRAKEEHAWCQFHVGDIECGVDTLRTVQDVLADLERRDLDRARCLWRLGKCCWDMGDRRREEAYRYFVTSLKCDPTHAPAFTSLGIYYTEFASPPDPTRASKCFQKAFELDARESVAARRLAEGFADEREWDLVEVIARRTIEGEGGLDAGMSGGEAVTVGRYLPTNAWAWKAVGVVELTHKNYSSAIQAFQIALRADPNDQLSWLRLGEAYSKAGRHVAAVKALEHARELQPDDWVCLYFIGDVQRQIGQFREAIDSLESILIDRPLETGVLMTLGQTYLDLGRSELATAFVVRAEQSFIASIHVALRAIKVSPGCRGVAWKTAADAIFYLSSRPSFTDGENVRIVLSEVACLVAERSSDHVSDIISSAHLQGNSLLNGLAALEIAIAAYDYRLSLDVSDIAGNGSAWFDLGIALHSWASKGVPDEVHQKAGKQASDCLIEALREDPGNAAYWNALGNVTFATQPKTAQHAYIKALEIDSKDIMAWTNLGLLYYQHDDPELATEAFHRAQTLDPDHTAAWLGQGILAASKGRDVEARAFFEHAVGLPVDVPEADLEYASKVFSMLGSTTTHGHTAPLDTIYPIFSVLNRYCKRRPDDASALHLFGLICERLGQLNFGVELVERAISILEVTYEDTEDAEVERQFIIATSSLARLRLSLHDYGGALQAFESVLGLLPEEHEDGASRILRAQAHFGSGLASFKTGDLEVALGLFEAAIESAGDNLAIRGQATVLLAQTLWAMDTEEFRETAKAQLLECITTDPENLTAINALAGMGILTEDDSLVDAALSEILGLPLERRFELDPQSDVNYLLIKHHLGQGDVTKALSVAQKAVFAEPSRPEARREVATLTLQGGACGRALAVLAGHSARTDDNLDTVRESLGLHAVAESLKGDEKVALRHAQRAIMLSPSQRRNWQILAYARAQTK